MSTDRIEAWWLIPARNFCRPPIPCCRAWRGSWGFPNGCQPAPGRISRKRRLRRVHAGRPLSLVSSGLIDPLSLLRRVYPRWHMKRGIAGLSLTDYGDWHGFDDADACSWSLGVSVSADRRSHGNDTACIVFPWPPGISRRLCRCANGIWL